jgi:hypothetical protein
MTHPFINDLSGKSLEDLQETISGLNKKLTFAYRMGNQPLIHQLHMALDSYRVEYSKKMDDLMKKQTSQINIQKSD